MGEVRTVEEWIKPLPTLDGVNTEYWKAASEGRLLVQECPQCGHRQFYPRALCTVCMAEPQWLECSGRGEVHTFTVVRQYGAKPFREELPYAIAMIALEEGPMMLGAVTDIDPDEVRIGMPVTVYFVRAADDVGIPYWKPA